MSDWLSPNPTDITDPLERIKMKSSEDLNIIIDETLMKDENFSLAYGQIVRKEEMQRQFEEKTGAKWQYCGVIAAYSELSFREINPCLRSPHYRCDREYAYKFKELLNEALDQMGHMNDTTVCRNERHVEKDETHQWFKDHIGCSITYPAFTSTSQKWQPVEYRNMFRIRTKEINSNARNIIPVMEIFQAERAKNENEILFKSPTTFSIDTVTQEAIHLSESDPIKESLVLTNQYWRFTDEELRQSHEQ